VLLEHSNYTGHRTPDTGHRDSAVVLGCRVRARLRFGWDPSAIYRDIAGVATFSTTTRLVGATWCWIGNNLLLETEDGNVSIGGSHYSQTFRYYLQF
jgi:hypothetical protein